IGCTASPAWLMEWQQIRLPGFARKPRLDSNLTDFRPYRLFPTVGVEAERTALAGIDDLAVRTDQAEPHWQSDIAFFDPVVDRVDQHWHLEIEIDLTNRRHRSPLGIAPRLAEADVLTQIFGHAPTIVGVRFPNADDIKTHLALVLAVNFVQAHGPVTKINPTGCPRSADRRTLSPVG